MTSTYPIVLFGENALAIKNDVDSITIVQGGLLSGATADDLETEVVSSKYITVEPNAWLLDGSYKFMPAAPHVGYMSTALSGASGNFGVPVPEIRIIFNNVYSTSGLTLWGNVLTDDWIDNVTIGFYNSVGGLIRSDTYSPTSAEFHTNQAVSNFKRIDIFINSMSKAYRFARLLSVDFDDLVRFSDTSVKEALLVEEISPLSTELPINTLDLTLFSDDADFSIVEPSGFYAGLEEKAPLDVYEVIDWETVFMGRFYLDTWESKSENLATFKASDAIGLDEIDKELYYASQEGVWVEDHSDDITDEIMSGNGIDYEIDASLADIDISGWLPLLSKRETLQNVWFRAGGYLTCARSRKILVKPFEAASSLSSYDFTLTNASKSLESPVILRPVVSGVKAITSYYQYTLTGNVIIFSGRLPVGTHLIHIPDGTINEIASLTGGTGTGGLNSYGANWFTITVTVAGTFEVTSTNYFTRITDSVVIPTIATKNTINIDNVGIITSGISSLSYDVTDVLQRVYDYYQQRYVLKTRLFASRMAVGDSVISTTQSGKQIKGIVEKMRTDLARGMASDVEIVGVVI